jgi:hypothetical protein
MLITLKWIYLERLQPLIPLISNQFFRRILLIEENRGIVIGTR